MRTSSAGVLKHRRLSINSVLKLDMMLRIPHQYSLFLLSLLIAAVLTDVVSGTCVSRQLEVDTRRLFMSIINGGGKLKKKHTLYDK